MDYVDFRSDTVTRPTQAMMAAIAAAEVGDAARGDDPTVNELERRAAELVGKQAAVFVPSGTMGNLVAVLSHVSPGEEIILESAAHMYNSEGGAVSGLAGAVVRPVTAPSGVLDPDVIAAVIKGEGKDNVARTRLICVENTHNAAGGTVTPLATMGRLHGLAAGAGVVIHLDGARLFNAAVHLDSSAADICRHADTVMFCVSKGLGAPVGSLLAGDDAFILRARRKVRMVGGGMRQAGIVAAAGLVALGDPYAQARSDHCTAGVLAAGLAAIDASLVVPQNVQTNIVNCRLDAFPELVPHFAVRLKERGVLVLQSGSVARFVTHRHIDEGAVERGLAAVADTLQRT
jgi:threonine aldolase